MLPANNFIVITKLRHIQQPGNRGKSELDKKKT